MDFSGDGVSVYAEAKGEYTRQLCQYLSPALQKYFLNMIDLAKERETDPKKHLLSFQILLEGISEWNVDKVQRETQSVAISTQCDYLEELLTAVFIAHTKVLSAIRLTNKHKKLQITIPKLEHFLHRTLTECARLLWTNTYLFSTAGSSLERQKNMRQIEALITEGVLQGVRTMLPVKSILREYLSTDDVKDNEEEEEEEEEDEDDEEEEPEPEEKPKKSKKKPVEPTGPMNATGATESVLDLSKQSNSTGIPDFDPKQFDIYSNVETVSKPASKNPTPMPSPKAPLVTVHKDAPAIPTIVLDGKPRVDFSEVNSFFSKTDAEPKDELEEADFDQIQEADIESEMGPDETTTLDFSEFEELS
jgi:hypothetical protein